ncbi:MAG: hypothetical protein M1821_009645 [Bathelium mastoideum]|nr:MAG: hypothetical protein M1821_009645 [Bathelium mastoideum]
MAPPSRQEVYVIFKNLENPDGGIELFLKSFHPEVKYIVPGHGRFARSYDRLEDYAATFSKLRKVLRPPGFKFIMTNGIDDVITGEDGRAVVRIETQDTYTASGVEYKQYYSWHLKFNDEKQVVGCRAYLDLGYLEDVIGSEMKKQGIA